MLMGVPLLLTTLGAAGWTGFDLGNRYLDRKRARATRTARSAAPAIDDMGGQMERHQINSALLDLVDTLQSPRKARPDVDEAMNRAAIRQIMGQEGLESLAQESAAIAPLLSMLR